MDPADEVVQLKGRMRILEERIQGLRASRRILMNLISAQEREKRARIEHLEAENSRLQQQSARYAKAVLDRNIEIYRLEQSLRRSDQGIS